MTSVEDPVKLDEVIEDEEIEVSPEQAKDAESGEKFEEPVKQPKNSDAEFPMREATLRFACFKQDISFNPAVSLIGFIPLWALAIYCVVTPDAAGDALSAWFNVVIEKFTWFYIGKLPIYNALVAYRRCKCYSHYQSLSIVISRTQRLPFLFYCCLSRPSMHT